MFFLDPDNSQFPGNSAAGFFDNPYLPNNNFNSVQFLSSSTVTPEPESDFEMALYNGSSVRGASVGDDAPPIDSSLLNFDISGNGSGGTDPILDYFEQQETWVPEAEAAAANAATAASGAASAKPAPHLTFHLTGIKKASLDNLTARLANNKGIADFNVSGAGKHTLSLMRDDGKVFKQAFILAKNGTFSFTSRALPMGAWLKNSKNGVEIHLGTKREDDFAAKAYAWGTKTTQLKIYTDGALAYNYAKLSSLAHYYNVWSHGRVIVASLGDIVQNGAKYARQTFWGAMGRLTWAILFQEIEDYLQKEADTVYSNGNDPWYPTELQGPADHLKSYGTTALGMFLYNTRQDVVDMNGLPVFNAKKKNTGTDTGFTRYVRDQLIILGNLLSKSKGTYAAAIQTMVQECSYGLWYLFDGVNDPYVQGGKIYDPHRELQAPGDRDERLRFLGGASYTVDDTYSDQSLQEILDGTRTHGFMTAVVLPSVNDLVTRFRNPSQGQINAEADRAWNHYIDLQAQTLADNIMEIMEMPDAFMHVERFILDAPGLFVPHELDPNNLRATLESVDILPDLRAAIINYIRNPASLVDERILRSYFGNTGLIHQDVALTQNPGTITEQDRTATVITADGAMTIINTMLLGTPNPQPAHLQNRFWRQIFTDVVAAHTAIARVRPDCPTDIGALVAQFYATNYVCRG